LVWQQAQLFRGSESKARSLGPSREVARGPGWACSAATLIARCRKPARQISQRTWVTRIYAMIVNWPWARASLPTYVAVSNKWIDYFVTNSLVALLEALCARDNVFPWFVTNCTTWLIDLNSELYFENHCQPLCCMLSPSSGNVKMTHWWFEQSCNLRPGPSYVVTRSTQSRVRF